MRAPGGQRSSDPSLSLRADNSRVLHSMPCYFTEDSPPGPAHPAPGQAPPTLPVTSREESPAWPNTELFPPPEHLVSTPYLFSIAPVLCPPWPAHFIDDQLKAETCRVRTSGAEPRRSPGEVCKPKGQVLVVVCCSLMHGAASTFAPRFLPRLPAPCRRESSCQRQQCFVSSKTRSLS